MGGDILMSFRATLDAIELLDSGVVDGEQVVKFLKDLGLDHVETTAVRGGGKGSHRFCQNGYSWISR